MSNLTKYLVKYAEAEIHSLQQFPTSLSYSHVIVIPAYKENSHFVEYFLQTALAQQNVLLIVVINQPESDKNSAMQRQLADDICGKGEVSWQVNNLSLIEPYQHDSAILIVDRYNIPINDKLGVGHARKIGTDIACQLICQQILKTAWIHSTDADAQLPNDYFSSLVSMLEQQTSKNNTVAACYNFVHQSDEKLVDEANAVYEQSLRYYVGGLSYANSSYDYFTIGSVIAFNAEAYASVRGFPKRSAGEDFYLLNKLAKLGQVAWLRNCTVRLEARTSDRVPFGTGPAVAQIMQLLMEGKSYHYYHPQLFILLKSVIKHFNCLFEHKEQMDFWYQKVGKEVQTALFAIGFDGFVTKLQLSNQKQFNKQLKVWFDAFKTLKFLHYLRDNYHANIPLDEAIKIADFDIEK